MCTLFIACNILALKENCFITSMEVFKKTRLPDYKEVEETQRPRERNTGRGSETQGEKNRDEEKGSSPPFKETEDIQEKRAETWEGEQ